MTGPRPLRAGQALAAAGAPAAPGRWPGCLQKETQLLLFESETKKRGTERVGLAGPVLPPCAADPAVPPCLPAATATPTRRAGPLGAGAGQRAQRDPSRRSGSGKARKHSEDVSLLPGTAGSDPAAATQATQRTRRRGG